VSAWKDEASAFLMPGQSMQLDDYTIELVDVVRSDRDNFVSQAGTLAVSRNGRELGHMVAERRFYPVREMATTESAIRARLDGDLYVTIGEGVEGRGWAVHAYLYPLAVWLWIGSALLALGGLLALGDRGRRALTARKPAAPGPVAVIEAEAP
jgi:cytochrome c-type biogenesis protein CcmF